MITLSAPLSLTTALRPRFERVVRDRCAADRSSQGTSIAAWRRVWSPYDYIASDPDTALPADSVPGDCFRNEPIEGSRGYWLFNDHAAYFDDDRVAAIILDRSAVPPASAATAAQRRPPAPGPADSTAPATPAPSLAELASSAPANQDIADNGMPWRGANMREGSRA